MNKLLVVAMASIVLVALMICTVNAATFAGTLHTVEQSSGTVDKIGDISLPVPPNIPSINKGADVTWDNYYCNRIGYQNWGYSSVTCSEISGLRDGSGVYLEDRWDRSMTRAGRTYGNPGTYSFTTKHTYSGNGPTYTSPNSNQLSFNELSY